MLFLPLYNIKIVSNKLVRLNLIDILILAIILIWPALPEFKKKYQKIYHFFKNEKLLTIGFVFLTSSLIISTLFSIDPLKSLGAIKSWFVLPIMFFLINCFTPCRVNKYKIVGISGTITALISLSYFLCQNFTYDGRLKGFFEHPNYLAMFLAPSLFIIICTKFQVKFQIYWRMILAWLIGLTIFATYSYNTWLAIIASFLFYLIIFQKIKMNYLATLLIISVALISTQIDNPKFFNLFSQTHSSLKERLIIYKVSIRIIKDNFITGIGLNNFQRVYLDYQKYFEPYPNWAVPMPHNFILAILVQIGIFGLVGFILIIVWAYKTILIQKKDHLGFLILTFYLVVGLFDTPYFKPDLAFLFWLAIF